MTSSARQRTLRLALALLVLAGSGVLPPDETARAWSPRFRFFREGSRARFKLRERDASGAETFGTVLLRVVAVEPVRRAWATRARFVFEHADGTTYVPGPPMAVALPSEVIVGHGFRLSVRSPVRILLDVPRRVPTRPPPNRVFATARGELECFAYVHPPSPPDDAFTWRFCLDASGAPREYVYESPRGDVFITQGFREDIWL